MSPVDPARPAAPAADVAARVRAEPAPRDVPPVDVALFADFAPRYEALESIERLVLQRLPEASR